MKKLVLLLSFLFIVTSIILAQTIIENPEKPLSKNARRIVKLKEVMRIRDNGKDVIFRFPYELQIGPDGGIYFYDNWMLHKFDKKGQFIFKIVKQGEGPGEAIRRTRYLLTKDEIIIQSRTPPKIMRFNLNGEFKSQKRLDIADDFRFIGIVKNKIYFYIQEFMQDKYEEEGFVDIPANLHEISYDFNTICRIFSFPIKHYVIKRSASWPRARINYALKDSQNLFITHTNEYQIIKFNIEKNKIEKIFKRKYRRVKYPPQPEKKYPPNALYPPPYKYHKDIQELLLHEGRLWVITSTLDNRNRRLIDVYNMEGEYIDNFYIEFPENINIQGFGFGSIQIKEDYIYTIDEHSDEYFSIGKYMIMN